MMREPMGYDERGFADYDKRQDRDELRDLREKVGRLDAEIEKAEGLQTKLDEFHALYNAAMTSYCNSETELNAERAKRCETCAHYRGSDKGCCDAGVAVEFDRKPRPTIETPPIDFGCTLHNPTQK